MKLKLLTIIQLLCTAIFAQTPPLSFLSNTDGGSTYEVCYYNNYLYAGCANTLEVFDLTGPNKTPGTLHSKKRFISNIDNIQVHNGFLYICANHDGLYKYNLSNPGAPSLIAHYAPQNLNESIYDIAFYGDSLFVAAKTKINILLDSNNVLTYKSTVVSYTTSATQRIRGLDIKDSLLAYTVCFGSTNAQTGVYLRNIKTNQQLNFYRDSIGNPVEVYFGQNTKLLHVMGGTLQAFLSVNGRYYALDYTNPNSLQLKFTQTINGLLLFGSISCPMSACLINDTVYVATQGGIPIGYTGSAPLTGQVYVFDGTNANNITLLTDIYAGLYHFDVDIDPVTRKMYIASEWYGILTVDVNNIYNEVSYGKTLTGGWCHGSANAKNRLVEASEGYGIRLFDVSLMQTPTLLKEDTAVGFCRAISLSDSADYVYAWFLTGKRFRVQDGNNLNHIAGIGVDTTVLIPSDFKKSRHHNNKVAVIEEINSGNKKIVVADVTNPAAPVIQSYRQKNNINDILFHPTGVLFACADDSLIVFDQNTMAVLGGVNTTPLGGLFPQYKSLTLSNDTIYTYHSGTTAGIAKFLYNQGTHSLTYITSSAYTMKSTYRIFMANENSLLYIGSSIDSLRAITKGTPYKVIAKYNHGADFIFDNLWGNTDLYYNKGYLFLNEYMGQTTIFGSPTNISGIQAVGSLQSEGNVYPNPTSNYFTVKTNTKNESTVRIYDLNGKLIYMADVFGEKITLDISALLNGFYFVSVLAEGKETKSKLVKE